MKVIRIRAEGFDRTVDGELIPIGSKIWRFIGDEEIANAKDEIIGDWELYSKPDCAPTELVILCERIDKGKKSEIILYRDMIDELPGVAKQAIKDLIDKAINL